MSMILNRSKLSEAMGVSMVTIDTWRKEGMPFVQRGAAGKEWQFDLAACVKWYGQRKADDAAGDNKPDDLLAIEKRAAKAKMLKAELELAVARGELAPIRDFERAQSAVFAEIRTNVMNVAQRVVLQLIGETDESVFKQKLKSELALALKAAADAPLILADEDENDDEDE